MKIIVDNLIFEALKPSEFREYMKVERDSNIRKQINQIWSKLQVESIGSNRNGDRLYFNITEKVDFWGLKEIPVSIKIDNFFKENGFEIVDVKNNKAKNLKDGRIVSIMKVLESLRKVNPELVAIYIKEYDRERSLMLDKQEKIMVISKSAYDIAGMATDRGFSSCLNIRDGINKEYVPSEIESGVLVSYLISPDDKNINNPYARVSIKPYLELEDETNVLYGIEHDIIRYGKRDPEYIKTLINLLDKAQKKKIGVFKLNPYSFNDFGETIKFKKSKKISPEKSLKNLEKLLNVYNIKNYIINPDNSIDVEGDVDLTFSNISNAIIPFNFNVVTGSFICKNIKLKSLYGAPKEVGKDFDCSGNILDSLEFGPKTVGGDYFCNENSLRSLKYSPEIINGDFKCSTNKLKTLEFGPSIVLKNYNCADNNLKSLFGSPFEINGNFICSYNELREIKDIPKSIKGDLFIDNQNTDIIFDKNEIEKYSKVDGVIHN